jgi:hypothetical protein
MIKGLIVIGGVMFSWACPVQVDEHNEDSGHFRTASQLPNDTRRIVSKFSHVTGVGSRAACRGKRLARDLHKVIYDEVGERGPH